jgi:hypothetical protein
LQALFTRRSLIVRAADLHGLPADYPFQVTFQITHTSEVNCFVTFCFYTLQYVALTFYAAYIHGDIPSIATLTGGKDTHCCVDGTSGASLAQVSRYYNNI